ncbi:hypothetical protein D3M59_09810 [Sphingomonas edaphi]|uniref:Uncharacterized protein n=1 Tax=Sphingomonas edaphi TaxID=2315689 RepID=A0A418PYW9_9SPHN|nr:hypothetical protein D3M59_09810 [Sphingomonas edaphi]
MILLEISLDQAPVLLLNTAELTPLIRANALRVTEHFTIRRPNAPLDLPAAVAPGLKLSHSTLDLALTAATDVDRPLALNSLPLRVGPCLKTARSRLDRSLLP